MHLSCAFGHQVLSVQLFGCTFLQHLLVFYCPCHKLLYMCPFLGCLLHTCHKLKHGEVTLLCKVLLEVLLLLQSSCGFAIIPFWAFVGLLPFCFCCKCLGLLQDVTKVVKFRLLNNLKTTMWFLNFCFLNNRLRGSVGQYFVFIFNIGGCQWESELEWFADLTFRPLHCHIPCFF